MRHSWLIAIAAEPENIRRRVPADRVVTLRPLADGRTIVIAATQDVVLRESGGLLTIDPMRNVTIGSVDTTSGEIRLRRALMSALEVYWTASEGGLLLSGSLAELLPYVAPRSLVERSLVEHHLFFWPIGERTYVEGVSQLLPGHELHWDGRGTANIRQLQSGGEFATGERRPLDRQAAALQVDALRQAIVAGLERSSRDDRAVLLSGGVDSSILQMIMESVDGKSPLKTRNYTFDTPECLSEMEYARDAASIFRTQHESIRVSPEDYPALLIDAIKVAGRPFGHDSLPAYLALFRALGSTGPTTLWSGEGGDSIYGSWASSLIKPRYGYLPGPILTALGFVLRPFSSQKSRGAALTAGKMRALNDETGPDYPLNLLARFCDLDTVERWFGERAVKQAMTDRRQVATLLGGALSEIERLHMISLFTSAVMVASIQFQFGAYTGCTILSPFLDEGVLRAALRVDPDERYMHKNQVKPLLKLALEQRTGPAFIARPKRGGEFYHDLCTWMRNGVLADFVRSIERPGYVDRKSFQDKIEAPDFTTWNLLLMDLYAKHLRSLAQSSRAR